MKIFFLTSSMQGGGAERVAALLSNAWAERGDEVHLIPTFSNHGECVYALHNRVKLTFLFDIVGGKRGKLARLSALRSFMRAEHPDIIVSFLPHVNCAAILAAWKLNIPVVACERIYPPLFQHLLPMSYRILQRLLYPAAAALVGQTDPASEWLRARGGNARIATIPNPVVLPLPGSSPTIAPLTIAAPGRKMILWAGRFEEQKRPELLIDAFARIIGQVPEWDVVMLGEGPLRPSLERRIASAQLSNRIFLPGFLGNLGEWYNRADLFVMTSAFEGFPNTLMEAMAHGVASIAFDVPTGPAELSHDGQRLHLLRDDMHVARLSEALGLLTSGRTQRQALAARAAETARAYSLTAILAQWDALFAAVLNDGYVRGERTSS